MPSFSARCPSCSASARLCRHHLIAGFLVRSELYRLALLPLLLALVFMPALARAQDAVFGGLTITLGGGGWLFPFGVAVDSSGNIYIADPNNQAVTVMPPGCASSACVTSLGGGFVKPRGVAVDLSGNIYVADPGNVADLNGKVYEMTPGCASSSCVTQLGGDYRVPYGVAVDGAGNVYVVDNVGNQVVEFPPGCTSTALAANQCAVTVLGGDSTFRAPQGIAVDHAGNIYVATYLNSLVQEMPPGCADSSCVTTLGGGFNHPGQLAVDSFGNVFVADADNSQVKEIPPGCTAAAYSSNACAITTLGGGFHFDYGVAVDAGGNLYVADTYNQQVDELMLQSANFFSEPVGSTSTALSVKFTFTASVTISAVGFSPNFTLPDTGTCFTQNPTYTAGQSCTVDVQFSPKSPGPLYGAISLYNNANPIAVIGTALVQGIGVAPQVVFSPSPTASLGGGFSGPFGIAVDTSNNVYVADSNNNAIKEMPPGCASSSCATALGGGWDSPGEPAIDGNGNVYVPNYNNGLLQEMPPNCTSAAYATDACTITTLGPVFTLPNGVAVDGSGNVYVAEAAKVVEMPPGCTAANYSSGSCKITTLGGGFSTALGVAVDSAGNVYVADGGLSGGTGAVYKMPGGCLSSACVTKLGGGFKTPYGVEVDAAGSVYVADFANSAVYEMPAGCTSSACVTTLESLSAAADVVLDSSGNVYAIGTDSATATELLRATPPSLTFANTPAGLLSSDSPKIATVANIGNSALNISNLNYPVDFPEDINAPASDCPASGSLAAGNTCTFTIDFLPLPESATGTSTLLSEPLSFTDNNLNGVNVSQSVGLSGTETVAPAGLTSPAPGSVLTGPSVTFTWDSLSEATAYNFRLGTTLGSANLYGSGLIAANSVTVSNLPLNGHTLYLQLCTHINSSQACNNYTFTAATQAALASPPANSILPGPKATFSWSAGGGNTGYSFRLGTTQGGNNIYGSGAITATSATVSNLPLNGEKIYARLYTNFGSSSVYTDYSFTAASLGVLTSPAPGSVLSAGSTATFVWSAGGGAGSYSFRLGTTQGGNNIYGSGPVTATTATVTTLPLNGEKIYARLYTNFGTGGGYTDYVYTATSPSTIYSPAPGSVLPGQKVTFLWLLPSGSVGNKLWLGTSAGADNLFASGTIGSGSVTLSNLPTNGEKIYARLFTSFISGSAYTDSVFTAATQASLTSPLPNSTLTGSTVTFTWSAATGETGYSFRLGTTVGGNNIYGSGATPATSVTVTHLPTNGEKIYARLYTNYAASGVYTDYVFTAAAIGAAGGPARPK